MSDCLAWGDRFYSGSYFCYATSVEAFSVSVRGILPHMALGSCLEGQSTTLDLVNIIVLTLKPMQACCTAEWGLGLLLRSVRAPTGWLGWRAGICHALSKETWHLHHICWKLAWLADSAVRKSRCRKNNPSWKKLLLSPMKLLCVQLPAMCFAVHGLSKQSLTYVLTYLYLAVCNIST